MLAPSLARSLVTLRSMKLVTQNVGYTNPQARLSLPRSRTYKTTKQRLDQRVKVECTIPSLPLRVLTRSLNRWAIFGRPLYGLE
jgi:hypothetical protein